MNNSTIDYYNQSSKEYANKVKNVDMSETLDFFLKTLPKRDGVSFLLEIGAGTGRDLKILQNRGNFHLTAIEPSKELSKIIYENTGIVAIEKNAQEIDFIESFDGIYAIASLLHIPKKDMQETLLKIRKALVDDGSFMLSVKAGKGESLDENERFFAYYEANEIKEMLLESGFKDVDFNINADRLQREDLQWITISAKKDLSYELKNKENGPVVFKFK